MTVVFILFLLIFLFLFMYIRVKYRFWSIQPVFHFYDVYYWFFNKGIIRKEMPEKNRYTNFQNIKTFSFDKDILNNGNNNTCNREVKQFLHLIQNNYLKEKENIFYPKKDNVIPYFMGLHMDSFVSLYYQPILLEDSKNNSFVEEQKLVGSITTRPLHVTIINANDKNMDFDVYYVDYLCVDKNYRKKNIAPQLIQTHEYKQSYLNKKISVSLFKREGELTGIVPICVYKTYCFHMKPWTTPLPLPIYYKLLKGDSQNLYYLYDFIKENTNKWQILILPEISNLIELVKTNNVYIYMVLQEQTICAAYFFRKVCTSISSGKEVLSCFASIYSDFDENTFIHAFKLTVSFIVKEQKVFHYLTIEDCNDNTILVQNILVKSKPYLISPTGYFFYNFAYQTFPANKVFILN